MPLAVSIELPPPIATRLSNAASREHARTPVRRPPVVGSGTVSENTAQRIRAPSSSAVARSRMPHSAINGSVTISGLRQGRGGCSMPGQLGERPAADRHQPRRRNQRGHLRPPPLSPVFSARNRSTPPGCSPDSIISQPVVRQKCSKSLVAPGIGREHFEDRRRAAAASAPAAPSAPAAGTRGPSRRACCRAGLSRRRSRRPCACLWSGMVPFI